jgi:hypothetical protein
MRGRRWEIKIDKLTVPSKSQRILRLNPVLLSVEVISFLTPASALSPVSEGGS